MGTFQCGGIPAVPPNWQPTEYWTFDSGTLGSIPNPDPSPLPPDGPTIPTYFGSIHNTPLHESHTNGLPATVVTGLIGEALKQSPVLSRSDAYDTSSVALLAPGTNGFSFSFWWKMNATGDGSYSYEVSFDMNLGDAHASGLFFEISGTDNSLEAFVYTDNSSTGNFLDLFPAAQSLSSWHFGVATFDNATRTAALYLDNVLIGAAVFASSMHSAAAGTLQIGPTGSGTTFPDFAVDELGIWCNRVLTVEQIGTMWNSGAGARPPGI
jgi:hypothetical protein